VDLILRTPRPALRPPTLGDREAWLSAEVVNEAHWGRFGPRPQPGRTLNQVFDDFLLRAREGERDGTGYRFLAFESGEYVGQVALNNIVRRAFENAALGWRVTLAAQGRGLACEMVARAIDFAFAAPPDGLGLHRVEANIMPINTRSIRLAERLGMRRKGLSLRMLCINGEWEDHLRYALLSDEWSAAARAGPAGVSGPASGT
jgi:ribosomal-protein-alanine N-acetyltransferase